MRFKYLAVCLSLSLVSLSVAAAGEDVSVSFRMAAPGLAPLTATCSGARPSPIEVPDGILSGSHRYKGPAEAEFAVGHQTFPVQFPPTQKPLLVVLSLRPESVPRTTVVEDSASDRSDRDLVFINVGTVALGVKVASKSATVEPGSQVTIVPADGPTAFVQVTDPESGAILFSNNWSLSAKGRTLSVMEFDPALKPARLVFHRLLDLGGSRP